MAWCHLLDFEGWKDSTFFLKTTGVRQPMLTSGSVFSPGCMPRAQIPLKKVGKPCWIPNICAAISKRLPLVWRHVATFWT
ncbi:hypothetical protein CUC44_03040 [Aeromonas lusitana]|uniref:Uncharacterized protein n=1 Tax=Aeromonas lusitana TaxID=931529 RepID=A0A2M8HEE5_9GAMM|nr:hypothetical protein CUC44_03040 [Aeromonas lusitana]